MCILLSNTSPYLSLYIINVSHNVWRFTALSMALMARVYLRCHGRWACSFREWRGGLHSHAGVNQGAPTVTLPNSRRVHAFIPFDFFTLFPSTTSLYQTLLFVFLLFTFPTSQHNRSCKSNKEKSRRKVKIVYLDLDFPTLRTFGMSLPKQVAASGKEKKRLKVTLCLNGNYSNQELFGSNKCLSASKLDEPNHDTNYHCHEQ